MMTDKGLKPLNRLVEVQNTTRTIFWLIGWVNQNQNVIKEHRHNSVVSVRNNVPGVLLRLYSLSSPYFIMMVVVA